jgi:hypothetical protein
MTLMKHSLFALTAVFLAFTIQSAEANGGIPKLDAPIKTYDGKIVKFVKKNSFIEGVVLLDNNTKQSITFLFDGPSVKINGHEDAPLDDLKIGMRAVIRKYNGSKGARYAEDEYGERYPGTSKVDWDAYAISIRATSKTKDDN